MNSRIARVEDGDESQEFGKIGAHIEAYADSRYDIGLTDDSITREIAMVGKADRHTRYDCKLRRVKLMIIACSRIQSGARAPLIGRSRGHKRVRSVRNSDQTCDVRNRPRIGSGGTLGKVGEVGSEALPSLASRGTSIRGECWEGGDADGRSCEKDSSEEVDHGRDV